LKSIVSPIAFCCLFLSVGPAQVNPAHSLQPTPLEAFAHQPATHVTWSKQVGSVDSREAHAVVTVLVIEDTAQPPDRMRGIRIDFPAQNPAMQCTSGKKRLARTKVRWMR